MHQIPNKVDFYITNVCNLTCHNCNRFNNHDFRGWQQWSDYESVYQRWGQLVNLRAITIMGGEPFLNSTLKEWVAGLNNIFQIEVQILTNGTRFRQNKDLYPYLLFRSPWTQQKNHIGVSVHNMDDWPSIRESIYDFLQGSIEEYPNGHKKNIWGSDWYYVDSNGIMINVYIKNRFGRASIQTQKITMQPQIGFNKSRIQFQNTGFTLHNNDIFLAHQNCGFAQYKSYHFIKGKLYKCGPVALMPEFDQQHRLNISEEDRALLNSYRPLEPDNYENYHKEFFDNLDNPIPQCKFCPTKYDAAPIQPLRKGL